LTCGFSEALSYNKNKTKQHLAVIFCTTAVRWWPYDGRAISHSFTY